MSDDHDAAVFVLLDFGFETIPYGRSKGVVIVVGCQVGKFFFQDEITDLGYAGVEI